MKSYIFPGQGSQYIGMGLDLYESSTMVRDIMDRANEVLGWQLTGIMFGGTQEELTQTRNTQPAIFLHSYVRYMLLNNPEPNMVAGHSLGEYLALAIAGAINFDDALTLVKIRAESMQIAGESEPGTMAAIIGLDDNLVGDICCKVWEEIGIVQSANFNSPGQVVISGSPNAVLEAMKRCKENGARMVKQLNVSGAFHSPLMASAREKLTLALSNVHINNAEIPVYTNVSAKPITDAQEIHDSLILQLTSPVRWSETINNMIIDGADEFIEVGPGNVLQGLVKRINSIVTVSGFDKF